MYKKMIASTFLAAGLFALSAHAAEAPDERVRRSTNEILAAIKADKDLQAGNQAKIEKLAEEKVLPYFNFARMTQLAVGRNLRDANDAQKKSLTDEFRRLLVRTYSDGNMLVTVTAVKNARDMLSADLRRNVDCQSTGTDHDLMRALNRGHRHCRFIHDYRSKSQGLAGRFTPSNVFVSPGI